METQFESVEQLTEATAANLANAAAGAAFKLFRDKQFRKLAGFNRLSQTEQDRIFNELVAANLALVMLLLDAPDLRVEPDKRVYFHKLCGKIGPAYMGVLKGMGVEREHQNIWRKLLDMRHAEYDLDRHKARALSMQLSAEEGKQGLDELDNIQMMAPVHAVAIGCHRHVCRGETEGKDELFKLTTRAQGEFYLELRIKLEGGRITPLDRVRMAVGRFVKNLCRR